MKRYGMVMSHGPRGRASMGGGREASGQVDSLDFVSPKRFLPYLKRTSEALVANDDGKTRC